MCRALVLCFLMLPLSAQDAMPFSGRLQGIPTTDSARESWVRITNQQCKMSGKTLRVATEGSEGLTAVLLVPGVEKLRHAKPYLLGKDENELLFRSIVSEGFNRILVRNPDSGKQWSARLEKGKAILED